MALQTVDQHAGLDLLPAEFGVMRVEASRHSVPGESIRYTEWLGLDRMARILRRGISHTGLGREWHRFGIPVRRSSGRLGEHGISSGFTSLILSIEVGGDGCGPCGMLTVLDEFAHLLFPMM